MGDRGGAFGRGPTPASLPILLAALALATILPRAAPAFDLSGSASFFLTSLDVDGQESDLEDQQYSLSLYQILTPYVAVRLGYNHTEYLTQRGADGDFLRRNREPRLELLYNRDRLIGRLEIRDRDADGTLPSEDFESSSLAANLAWRPRRGPGFLFGFRDESNVADQAVFGRSTDTRFVSFETFYDREHWGASYAVRTTRIENRATGFDSDQDRHEVRAHAARGFARDRVSFSISSSLSRLDRQTTAADATEFAEPVAALTGLFVVDTSPEIGELDTTPGLIDGDLGSAVPGIQIGGGATFRNLGVSLPVVSPVTRLEITVDVPSDPALVWQVFRSSDNLLWEPVDGVVSTWDEALLRYTLRFPETGDRFFKAVNVSANAEPIVGVTEVRALVDRQFDGDRERLESTLYRVDGRVNFRPHDRISGSLSFGASNDEDVSTGFVRRDFGEEHGAARLTATLHPDLLLNVGYQFSDAEDLREPVLLRTVETLFANLTWTPLPTVDAVLSAQQRDEREESTLLQQSDSVRLIVTAELLPDLRLVTDLETSTIDLLTGDLSRRGWQWGQRLEARPTPRWTLGGGYSESRFEAVDGEVLFERSQLDVRTTWLATSYLTLSGQWSVGEEATSRNVRQSYNLTYSPGPKLSISAFFQDFETLRRSGTTSDSLSVSYRINRHLSWFANLSRSTFEEGGAPSAEIESLRTGLRLFF